MKLYQLINHMAIRIRHWRLVVLVVFLLHAVVLLHKGALFVSATSTRSILHATFSEKNGIQVKYNAPPPPLNSKNGIIQLDRVQRST